MLLDCNGGRIQEGQSKIRSGCSCRKEWWRERRIVQFFFPVASGKGPLTFARWMSALILGDPWECIPAHGAAVPSEPPARLSDGALCQLSALHTLPKYSSTWKGRIFLSPMEFCSAWSGRVSSCCKMNILKVYLNVGHWDLISFLTNQDGTEPSFIMNACCLLHLS